MTSTKDASASVLWHEPIEGLEFGELLLGSMASTYFARGRTSGYGFCFTDRRIIGFRMRRVSLALKAPFITLISVLYLFVLLEISLGQRSYSVSYYL
ncbi:MAG TPA: hypothetical protein VE955_01675 [Candidatus Dormibacteraeota bacterium]|nr:hypothetical protein [Candidatus Dormibacteraeota bacterium]